MHENKFYSAVKERMFEEMNNSLQRHPTYAGKVQAVNKLHMGKERPQVGVMLESASASRIILSPDDCIGDLKSLVIKARVGNHPGNSVEWAWEDTYNITKKVIGEDASSTVDPQTSTTIRTAFTPLAAGQQNPEVANNIGQVRVSVNGVEMLPRFVNGTTGVITLPISVPAGADVRVSYFYRDLDKPGYYFLEMIEKDQFILTPLFTEEDELVLPLTTGTETEAQLSQTPVLLDYTLNLYLQKTPKSVVIFLERGTEYTVSVDGVITFLSPLPPGSRLFASYRWQGSTRGPFLVEKEYTYVANAIKGVSLCFGSRRLKGDKCVIIFTNTRERVANVKGGHYSMSMDWKVFSRDPQTTSEIADHLVDDIWSNRREILKEEGLSIEQFHTAGETEETYDDSTSQYYWQASIPLELMSEWKKFIPYVMKLNRYKIRAVPTVEEGPLVGKINPLLTTPLDTAEPSIEIVYPMMSYPVFY